MEFGKPKVKACWPWHAPNLKELGFEVGSSFIGVNHSISTLIKIEGFKPCKTIVSVQIWKRMILPNKRGANLKTQLLEVRHTVKVYILLPWLTKLQFETDVFERVWPPFNLGSESNVQ